MPIGAACLALKFVGFVLDRAGAFNEVTAPTVKRDLRNLFGRSILRHDGDEPQAQQLRKVGFTDRSRAAGGLDHGGAFGDPAIAQGVQKSDRASRCFKLPLGWVDSSFKYKSMPMAENWGKGSAMRCVSALR